MRNEYANFDSRGSRPRLQMSSWGIYARTSPFRESVQKPWSTKQASISWAMTRQTSKARDRSMCIETSIPRRALQPRPGGGRKRLTMNGVQLLRQPGSQHGCEQTHTLEGW